MGKKNHPGNYSLILSVTERALAATEQERFCQLPPHPPKKAWIKSHEMDVGRREEVQANHTLESVRIYLK